MLPVDCDGTNKLSFVFDADKINELLFTFDVDKANELLVAFDVDKWNELSFVFDIDKSESFEEAGLIMIIDWIGLVIVDATIESVALRAWSRELIASWYEFTDSRCCCCVLFDSS